MGGWLKHHTSRDWKLQHCRRNLSVSLLHKKRFVTGILNQVDLWRVSMSDQPSQLQNRGWLWWECCMACKSPWVWHGCRFDDNTLKLCCSIAVNQHAPEMYFFNMFFQQFASTCHHTKTNVRTLSSAHLDTTHRNKQPRISSIWGCVLVTSWKRTTLIFSFRLPGPGHLAGRSWWWFPDG
jgi:hypothetical protein